MNREFTNLLTIVVLACFSVSCSNKNTLLLGATTTLEDSGVLTELTRAFEIEHDMRIKPVIAGSGQIHELIKRRDIDTAITHDPAGEQALLDKKIIRARYLLMSNDFLIVGPAHDPAHIKHALTPDEAFEKINFASAVFVTRNDNSGTHQMELKWRQKIQGQQSQNYQSQNKLYIKTGTGMGATLAIATERSGYTLVDRGTWLNFSGKKTLKALFEDPEYLPNQYSVLTFGNNKADIWEQWLQSKKAQQLILNYRINNKPVFFNKRQ